MQADIVNLILLSYIDVIESENFSGEYLPSCQYLPALRPNLNQFESNQFGSIIVHKDNLKAYILTCQLVIQIITKVSFAAQLAQIKRLEYRFGIPHYRNSRPNLFCKIVFGEMLQNLQENTCTGVS